MKKRVIECWAEEFPLKWMNPKLVKGNCCLITAGYPFTKPTTKLDKFYRITVERIEMKGK